MIKLAILNKIIIHIKLVMDIKQYSLIIQKIKKEEYQMRN